MQSAGALAVVLALGISIITLRPASYRQVATGDDDSGGVAASPVQFVSILHSQPGAFQRLACKTGVDTADFLLDDRELVETLAAIGRPAGLIRSHDGFRLTDPVTDAELFPPEMESTPQVESTPAAVAGSTD